MELDYSYHLNNKDKNVHRFEPRGELLEREREKEKVGGIKGFCEKITNLASHKKVTEKGYLVIITLKAMLYRDLRKNKNHVFMNISSF